jgi:cellulose binding protein with CBM2 domain
MGRHTKDVEDDVPEGEGPRRRGGVGKVPLLPAVSGVMAIGAVVSAISTQQISLNFAGGAPPPSLRAQPQASDSAPPGERRGRRTARDDSSLTPRGGRASRGSSRATVTVALRTVSTSRAGFQGQVTITNRTTEPVEGWTLILRYPHTKILSAWDGTVIRKGDTLVMDNPAEHPFISPGRSVKVRFNAQGARAEPVTCSFNGRSC